MKPQPISPQYDSLPAELRQLPIWLVWRYELDGQGRWAKRPYIADQGAGRAKTNDATTWRSLDHALKFAPRASGLGLCFTATHYCGIDLDCCRNPETGAIAPWAQRLIARLDSYTEVSPSGTGVHIIVALTRPLPENGAHKHGGKGEGWEIGIYDRTSPRYFCATGVIVDGRNKIRTCDPDEFYPQFLAGEFDAEPAKPKSNGHAAHSTVNNTGPYLVDDRRARLQSGLWEGLYPSQSEGDLAFCSYLAAEYGNDPVLIDQAFRKSGLMRDKWDRRTSGDRTYGQITIERVIAKRRGRTQPADEPVIVKSIEATARPDMPEAVLDGRLGEIFQRRMQGCALGYAWPSLVTIAGTSIFLKHQGQSIRGNLFWCLVGPVGTGKTATFDLAMHALGVDQLNPDILQAKYGSAEGLVNDLKDAGSCVRLLAPDELAHLLEKCAIDHSSFPTFLTSAFNHDQQKGGTKKDAWEINCRLSIFGGVVEDRFADCFGIASVAGLYDRFLFGVCPRPYEYQYFPLEGDPGSISVSPPQVNREVFEVAREWQKLGIAGRVIQSCLRVAYICAAVDRRRELRGADLGPALALAKYQMKVRRVLTPNEGKNPDAQCAIAIMNWLREHAPNGEWVRRRDLSRGINSYRVGPGVFNRSLLNLQMNDEIELDLKNKTVRLLIVTDGDSSC